MVGSPRARGSERRRRLSALRATGASRPRSGSMAGTRSSAQGASLRRRQCPPGAASQGSGIDISFNLITHPHTHPVQQDRAPAPAAPTRHGTRLSANQRRERRQHRPAAARLKPAPGRRLQPLPANERGHQIRKQRHRNDQPITSAMSFRLAPHMGPFASYADVVRRQPTNSLLTGGGLTWPAGRRSVGAHGRRKRRSGRRRR